MTRLPSYSNLNFEEKTIIQAYSTEFIAYNEVQQDIKAQILMLDILDYLRSLSFDLTRKGEQFFLEQFQSLLLYAFQSDFTNFNEILEILLKKISKLTYSKAELKGIKVFEKAIKLSQFSIIGANNGRILRKLNN